MAISILLMVLVPIAQCMNINRGDKMDHLVSMSTNDFSLNNMAKEMAAKDPFFNEFVGSLTGEI